MYSMVKSGVNVYENMVLLRKKPMFNVFLILRYRLFVSRELLMKNFYRLILMATRYLECTFSFKNTDIFLFKTQLSLVNIFVKKMELEQFFFNYQRISKCQNDIDINMSK